MTTIYMDNAETISKKAFTRRVNRLDKNNVLYRIAEFDIEGIKHYNIVIID